MEMSEEKKKFIFSISIPLGFAGVMWAVKLTEILFSVSFIKFGLYPLTLTGLAGILTMPFIHADFNHLISNSIPLVLLGTGILYFYPAAAFRIFMIVFFMPDILGWFFARASYHIGASGMVYGFVSFLYFSGMIRRDTRSIALALIVTFLYGGLVWGILPQDNQVSYELHLFGAFSGIFCAFYFKKYDPPHKYDWEEEEEGISDEKPEISYKKGYPFN
ncbi:MAG: rhomboid family intramembrane serine protease [Ignavibacteria bacterium]